MKKIGLIGGLGPEATVDYYTGIINDFKNRDKGLFYPEIIIYSVNMSEFLEMMKNKQYDRAASYLLDKINSLADAGAEFVALTANTPHLLFDKLKEHSAVPLISIVEATCREAIKKGMKRPGLFGTGFTMNSSFYHEVFNKNGIEIRVPEIPDRELINYKLFSEIELGIFREGTKQLLVEIIEKMVKKEQIDSIILGCTEFPLILKETEYSGIPVLNTTRIHVREIIDYCLNT